ncbi:hypothetical protein ANCCAN_22634, partial [Ancylostoma caninum]
MEVSMDEVAVQPRRRGRPRVHANSAERLRSHPNAEQQRHRRQNENDVQISARRAANAEQQRHRRQNENDVQISARRAANAEQQRHRRQNENDVQVSARRAANAEQQRHRRQNENDVQISARRAANAQRQQIRRQSEDVEQRSARLLTNAERQRRRRLNEDNEQRTARRVAHADRQQRRRQNESAEQRSARLLGNVERERRRRQSEDTEQRSVRLLANAERQQRQRQNESVEQRSARRPMNAARQQRRRQNEGVAQRNERLRNDAVRHYRRRNDAADTTGLALRSRVTEMNYLGTLSYRCSHCGALHFAFEVKQQHPESFSDCCDRGRFNLNLFEDFPEEIKQLFLRGRDATPEERRRQRNFLDNIRNFNSALAMASMGAQVDALHGRGPYCYRIHGQIYHRLGALHPNQGEERQFGQIYILDTEMAAQQRLGNVRNSNCDPELMLFLSGWFAEHNVYAQSFKMMSEVEQLEMEAADREHRPPASIRMVFEENR